ncbi:hypothetical protein BJV78DRAFT_547565 [Lactifluus subvellereus]|nr:hypothetical protein BJV78DRAFT_547565 [Lactifluus subvellereus]
MFLHAPSQHAPNASLAPPAGHPCMPPPLFQASRRAIAVATTCHLSSLRPACHLSAREPAQPFHFIGRPDRPRPSGRVTREKGRQEGLSWIDRWAQREPDRHPDPCPRSEVGWSTTRDVASYHQLACATWNRVFLIACGSVSVVGLGLTALGFVERLTRFD